MSAAVLKLKPQPALLASLLDAITKLGADELGQVAQSAIDRMDALSPDPDLEGEHSEDELSTCLQLASGHGAGCNISDPDYAVDDKPCDEEEGV